MATRRPILPNDPERDRYIDPMEVLGQDLDIDIEDEEKEITENEDGSADIALGETEEKDTDHGQNLAEILDESVMSTLATDLFRKIERDKESRKKRDEQYEEGIRRTGLGNEAPGGADFLGASRVVHPMLAEGCVDFAASAMREIFPPDGPAKTKIEGEATTSKLEIANRQQRCLNWQLTDQISEYAEELEQTLTQVPMGGSQYMKFWYDGTLRRVTCEFVPIDDMLIPYACSDFYSAQRITHVQRLTQMVYEDRVDSGFYRNLDTLATSTSPEETLAGTATNKIEGKESSMENVDGERIVYEVNTFAKFEEDGDELLPYLISIDEASRKVVAIYRNWDEKDQARTRLEWIVEYGFIAWRGAYKIGLPHLIGGLSAAATGSLRALLDAAHMNNMPGFLRLKGARMGGQTKQVNPTQGVEIEAATAIDDIRKLVMALPYNQPSPVLFQLLGWLDQAAKGVVTTAEEKIKDASNQMPVGTALALIEQGAKVFSSIHARLHRSQRRALKIIARLNGQYLSTGEQLAKLGEVLATKEDFRKPLAVIPVSDPNIFSETQRYAQMQVVLAMAEKYPQAHNLYNVLHRMYELAKIPEVEDFLPEPKEPKELNPVAENSAAMIGSPIIAFPEQEHLAHLEVHMRFVGDPFLGGADYAMQRSLPTMMEHIKQHLAFLYAKTVFDIATEAVGTDVGEMLKNKNQSPQVDMLLASASKEAHAKLMQVLQPLGAPLQKMLQQIMAMQPPPVMDPSQALLKAEQMKDEREKMKMQGDQGLRTGEMQLKGQQAQVAASGQQAKLALAAQEQQRKARAEEQARLLEEKRIALEERSQQMEGMTEAERLEQAERALMQAALDSERDAAIKNKEVEYDHSIDKEKLEAEREHQRLQLEEMKKPGNQVPGA